MDLTDVCEFGITLLFYAYLQVQYYGLCSMVVFFTHLKEITVQCACNILIFGYFMPLFDANVAYQR